MTEKILIVEDEFIVANDLRIMLEQAGYKVCGIAASVAKAQELIESKKPDWILLDIFLQGDRTGIDLAGELTQAGIPFIYISANTNQAILQAAKATLPYGFLVKPFREKDLLVMLDIAKYRHEQKQKYIDHKELTIQEHIEEIVSRHDSISERLKQISLSITTVLPFEFLWVTRSHPKTANRDINILLSDQRIFTVLDSQEMLSQTSVSSRDFKNWTASKIDHNGKYLYNAYDFRKLRMEHSWIRVLSDEFKLESAIVQEITYDDETFQFTFFSRSADLYSKLHLGILNQFIDIFKLIIRNIVYGKEVVQQPVQHSVPLEKKPVIKHEPVASISNEYHGIIGNSSLLLAAMKKLELVAPDETSILILGESGTGKERIAHTIHKLSPRKSKPMVTVNCAALPITLIESELFGHEKGSFTGATDKRIGKFEQADGGTIFLDEIGELPLEAQVKLLRVLQEKEIERLGGNYTKKINVRIITATNRNLEKEVAEGRFRLDLYYRLNVFPIELPSLRQRKEDIPMLVEHFIEKFNKRSLYNITGISTQALEKLMGYEWPGNIRELEHLIERTMLLTEGDLITEILLPESHRITSINSKGTSGIKTLEEMEREHILSILKLCKGKIYGAGGAAELLNIPSTTLNSKIKKLGISFEFVK